MRVFDHPQVEKTHYDFDFYSSERRFLSYYHQVKHVLHFVDKENARKILVAGKGDGVVPKILEAYSDLNNLDLCIKTYDIAKDLSPDYVGDLIHLESKVKEDVDVIVCCQVLEHLPLDEALLVLQQMNRISKFVIMSVPYKSFTIRGTLKIPFVKELEYCVKIPIWKNRKGMVDSRHYWELGYSISVRDFIRKLKSLNFTILSSYILKKDGFKYFIILKTSRENTLD